jgi:hypothetical protein
MKNEQPESLNYYILGFTHDYYTLWHYTLYYTAHVEHGFTYWLPKENIYFLQNLSMDYDEAMAKITKKVGENWEEDLSQRGQYFSMSFSQRDHFAEQCPIDRYKFGKYRGQLIEEVSDDGYAGWYRRNISEEEFPEAFEFVTKVLVKTGELTKYKGEYLNEKELGWKKQDEAKNKLETGHFFTPGERVSLRVKLIERFGFDGMYGYTHIFSFKTKENQIVKYMGGSPPDISMDSGWTNIVAGVKHGEYQGVKETKLQRIKIA